mmetsp:Transcript_34333/g.83305  ORF Transcript_34333/g.83305 Transcript_34333/m.83305 type:complete len:277 (-) Transcript_34333:290-1120(-)
MSLGLISSDSSLRSSWLSEADKRSKLSDTSMGGLPRSIARLLDLTFLVFLSHLVMLRDLTSRGSSFSAGRFSADHEDSELSSSVVESPRSATRLLDLTFLGLLPRLGVLVGLTSRYSSLRSSWLSEADIRSKVSVTAMGGLPRSMTRLLDLTFFVFLPLFVMPIGLTSTDTSFSTGSLSEGYSELSSSSTVGFPRSATSSLLLTFFFFLPYLSFLSLGLISRSKSDGSSSRVGILAATGFPVLLGLFNFFSLALGDSTSKTPAGISYSSSSSYNMS